MPALEICCFNIESCLIAQKNGATRIELCDNPAEGGTTASHAFIKQARRLLKIHLFPIIRPRGGDFLYEKEDFEIMRDDVRFCKKIGCDGVVIGMLSADGLVDTKRTQRLVEEAYPLDVTFHRAFDRSSDPFQAMEAIIDCGCQRILTSGQQRTATEGIELLKSLVSVAAERIIIMPGSGVRSDNIAHLAQYTCATEFHSTARIVTPTKMLFVNPAMRESLDYIVCDGNEVKRMAGELG